MCGGGADGAVAGGREERTPGQATSGEGGCFALCAEFIRPVFALCFV